MISIRSLAIKKYTPYSLLFNYGGAEVGVKSSGNAKTLRITLYVQNWGCFSKVGLGLCGKD